MVIKEAPFIFALKHLRMEWDASDPAVEPRIMQGAREIPPASDEPVRVFLAKPPPAGSLPEEFEQHMLDRMLPTLPAEVKLCFDGISKFGARRNADAARCAYEALTLNQHCRLARQLLSLLLAKTEVRCAAGVAGDGAPDVPGIILREVR